MRQESNQIDATASGPGPPSINARRMVAHLEELAAINRQADGSCCRLALSDADRAGRDRVVGWMREAGLEVCVDRIGNIVGRTRAGRGNPVMSGSHIDTVATGGVFDGAYGVMAAIEVVHTLKGAGIEPPRPLAVAVFTNEEGARFHPDMMGSMVYTGQLSLEAAMAARDRDGVSVSDELERIGYAGEELCGAIRPHAFVELHIEQGPVLDREHGVLGAVTDVQGISWQEIVLGGTSNHAGTTPMHLRRDAAHGAARVTLFARELTRRIEGQVATVGSIRLSPNLVNVIARQATLTVDLRNIDESRLSGAEQGLTRFLGELAAEENLTVEARTLVRTRPVRFDAAVLDEIIRSAADLGQPIRRMPSGAGHDAQMMAQICPTAMIFVPSIGGISHNPQESTRPEHLELGANVLLRTLLRLAGV